MHSVFMLVLFHVLNTTKKEHDEEKEVGGKQKRVQSGVPLRRPVVDRGAAAVADTSGAITGDEDDAEVAAALLKNTDGMDYGNRGLRSVRPVG